MTEPVVALDIGGTTIKAATFTADDAIAIERRWPTPRDDGPDAVIAAVLTAAGEMIELTRSVLGVAPVAVGVASLGIVDAQAGIAVRSTTVGWSRVPLAAFVEARVELPVALVHDVGAAALAEAARLPVGAADNLLFVAVGTGIGGTVVLGGEPVSGAHHRAGEIGHIPVRGVAEPCACGQTGCLETVASARAIVRAYRTRAPRATASSAASVVAAAAQGDPAAVEVWSRACRALGEGLATYSILVDPRLIVLGGGVSLAGSQLLEPVREELARRLTLPGVPDVVAARFGDVAALRGAAIAARRRAVSGWDS